MSYIETRLIIDGKSYDGRQIELIELGRNVERERIIKLFHISEEPWTLEELTALIKGEK